MYSTPMSITAALHHVLNTHGIAPEQYRPAYGGSSAGLDLYNAGPDLEVVPGQKCLMPTGIRLKLASTDVALIKERGSITKTPLMARAGVIDCDYTGEVFVAVWNLSDESYWIREGAKSPFQMLVHVVNNRFHVVPQSVYQEITSESERQDGAIGSSDVASQAEEVKFQQLELPFQ